ncbi:MAG: hypothetical protein UU25_C0002G0011 [Microgenomates group bacterium GW2011_GWB1_40_9]|nr:MAG: hypothetical protein UU25_C0002G0011 [Microgenomates group bacterium GW2011_GWB1_40_9]
MQTIKKTVVFIFSMKFFKEYMLVLISLFLFFLIWLNRYTYIYGMNTEADGNNVSEIWRISNLTSEGCLIKEDIRFKADKILRNFSTCVKLKSPNR